MNANSGQSVARCSGLSTPLVASLLGFLAAAALAVPLTLQVTRPPQDPVEWAHGPVPVLDDAGFAPPAGCGAGRLILSACGKTDRRFAIYLPSDYYPALPGKHNRARSYPLVVWATSKPIDRETASELARTWGPSADRDRYMMLMPQLTGDWKRDAADLRTMIAQVRHWWLVTDGPVFLNNTPDCDQLIAQLIPDHWPQYFQAPSPDDVYGLLRCGLANWDPVRIEYRLDASANDLSILYLVPVVAARLGRIAEYRWDCKELGWPKPTKMVSPEMVIQQPGTFTVWLTIRDEAGQTFSCERKVIVPPANKSTPPSCLPQE